MLRCLMLLLYTNVTLAVAIDISIAGLEAQYLRKMFDTVFVALALAVAIICCCYNLY